jgi:hypothetical protein
MGRYGAPKSGVKIRKKKETTDMVILSIKKFDEYMRIDEPWTWKVDLLDENGRVVESGRFHSVLQV